MLKISKSSWKYKLKREYHLILAGMFFIRDKRQSSFIEHMEKRDILYTVGGHANEYNLYRKQFRVPQKKNPKQELPCYLVILLLTIYPEEMKLLCFVRESLHLIAHYSTSVIETV